MNVIIKVNINLVVVMSGYVIFTILTALSLTSLTYGDVDSNREAPYAAYSDDGVLTYDLVQEPELSIFIKKLNDEPPIKINLSRDTFIYEIKDLIEEIWGAPFDKQRLVYNGIPGRVLEDHQTMDFYLYQVRKGQLYDGVTLYLVLKG